MPGIGSNVRCARSQAHRTESNACTQHIRHIFKQKYTLLTTVKVNCYRPRIYREIYMQYMRMSSLLSHCSHCTAATAELAKHSQSNCQSDCNGSIVIFIGCSKLWHILESFTAFLCWWQLVERFLNIQMRTYARTHTHTHTRAECDAWQQTCLFIVKHARISAFFYQKSWLLVANAKKIRILLEHWDGTFSSRRTEHFWNSPACSAIETTIGELYHWRKKVPWNKIKCKVVVLGARRHDKSVFVDAFDLASEYHSFCPVYLSILSELEKTVVGGGRVWCKLVDKPSEANV